MITNAQQDKIEAAHDRQALEERRIDRGDCPKCGSENTILRKHRAPGVAADDYTCSWLECADCGHGSEPS